MWSCHSVLTCGLWCERPITHSPWNVRNTKMDRIKFKNSTSYYWSAFRVATSSVVIFVKKWPCGTPNWSWSTVSMLFYKMRKRKITEATLRSALTEMFATSILREQTTHCVWKFGDSSPRLLPGSPSREHPHIWSHVWMNSILGPGSSRCVTCFFIFLFHVRDIKNILKLRKKRKKKPCALVNVRCQINASSSSSAAVLLPLSNL